MKRNKKCFSNIPVNHPKFIRLKVSHILIKITENKKIKYVVNWTFWQELINKREDFDIYIDEAHNIINSRRSMSNWNIHFNSWLTQIRKILGSSEKNDIFFITQRFHSLDITIRELCSSITYCRKIVDKSKTITTITECGKKKEVPLNDVFILHATFTGELCSINFEHALFGQEHEQPILSYFFANPLFKYYDSYELVKFGESDYL